MSTLKLAAGIWGIDFNELLGECLPTSERRLCESGIFLSSIDAIDEFDEDNDLSEGLCLLLEDRLAPRTNMSAWFEKCSLARLMI